MKKMISLKKELLRNVKPRIITIKKPLEIKLRPFNKTKEYKPNY